MSLILTKLLFYDSITTGTVVMYTRKEHAAAKA